MTEGVKPICGQDVHTKDEDLNTWNERRGEFVNYS